MTSSPDDAADLILPEDGETVRFKLSDYWSIEVADLDWLIILSKWLQAQGELGPQDLGVAGTNYRLRKARFPAEALAKVLGTTPDKLRNLHGTINLKPLVGVKDWPKPSVPYWGNA